MKKLLYASFIILNSLKLNATHLIGGEMTYNYLGNNIYQINLVIYIDCGPSNTSGTSFDPFGEVTIYNGDNSIYDIIDISNPNIINLGTETVGNDCLELPTDLCVERGTYSFDIFLPNSIDGYTVAYQRCCRNPSVINIENPEDFGSTFFVNIPGGNLNNNSSANFINYPPLALCLGDEININHSATDIDGDELVYEFTTPLNGANDMNPTEISPPPFNIIPWNDGYSENYPIDSDPIISINSETGIITGTPNQIGLYIIGIKVSEFRNGIFLNQVIRDFRFLVVDCNVTTASFPLTNWYCNSLTVDFENDSYNAETYLWDFGYENNISELFEPSFTYPDTGIYNVTLIANPNTICADTNSISFPLYTELSAFFNNPSPQCDGNNLFDFTALGITPPGADVIWNFGPNASPQYSEIINPTNILFDGIGNFEVSYNIQYNGCDETHTGNINIFNDNILPEITFLNDDIQCLENNLFNFQASGSFEENSEFLWNFGNNSNTFESIDQNPSNIQFLTEGYHIISLIISNSGCQGNITDSIKIIDAINFEMNLTNQYGCSPQIVNISSNLDSNQYNFEWDFGNGQTSNFNYNEILFFEGQYDLNISIIDLTTSCVESYFFENYIEIQPKPIANFTFNSDDFILDVPVEIENLSVNSDSIFYIFNSGLTLNGENPSYTPDITGEIEITQYAINSEYQCVDSISKKLNISFGYNLFMPNSFTPNNDNKNDFFAPISIGIQNYQLKIFDRWGKLIFDKYGVNPKWDGKNRNGIQCKSDTYNYLINFTTVTNKKFTENGAVYLIR